MLFLLSFLFSYLLIRRDREKALTHPAGIEMIEHFYELLVHTCTCLPCSLHAVPSPRSLSRQIRRTPGFVRLLHGCTTY